MSQRTALILGTVDAPEFVAVVAWLKQRVSLDFAPNCATALTEAFRSRGYSWIFLCQQRPGEHRVTEVESLSQAFPLSRLVALTGAWCEGEGRSGRPIPGVWRMPAESAPGRLARFAEFGLAVESMPTEQQADSSRFDATRWRIPRLLSESERLWEESQAALPIPARTGGLVSIVTTSRVAYDSLADAVQVAGFATNWELPGEPARARQADWVLWDLMRGDASELVRVETWMACRPESLLLSWGFPRPEDRAWALRLEAVRGRKVQVLAKPWRLAELTWHLSAHADSRCG